MLYLVFKEPTPTEPETRSRWHSPCPCGPFLGEPSKVTKGINSCQPLERLYLGKSTEDKKIAPELSRSNFRLSSAGFRLPNERALYIVNQYTRSGWVSKTPSPHRRQRILAEQALSSGGTPRALSNTSRCHLYSAVSETSFSNDTALVSPGQGTDHR